jgi:hypothetical protein
MTDKPSRDDRRAGPGFMQGLLQFFTSVTGMITACIALLGGLVTLAVTQQKAAEPSPSPSPPHLSSGLTDSPRETSAKASIDQPISDTASSSYVDLVEGQIKPQLTDQVQAQVPDAVVSVDSVDCSTPDNGTCTAAVSDSLGNQETLSIAYVVLDPSTGLFQWRLTG